MTRKERSRRAKSAITRLTTNGVKLTEIGRACGVSDMSPANWRAGRHAPDAEHLAALEAYADKVTRKPAPPLETNGAATNGEAVVKGRAATACLTVVESMLATPDERADFAARLMAGLGAERRLRAARSVLNTL